MARREAAACFLISDSLLRAPWTGWDVGSPGDAEPALEVRVRPCPQCGADDQDSAGYVQTLPFWLEPGDVRVVPSDEHRNGRTSLTVLGCEAIPVRAFLLIAVARRHLGSAGLQLQSRASLWAQRGPVNTAGDVAELLSQLDAGERWADGLVFADPPDGLHPGVRAGAADSSATRILPSSTRRNMIRTAEKRGTVTPEAAVTPAATVTPEAARKSGAADLRSHRAHLPARFITPHPISLSGWGEELNAQYASVRIQRAAEILRAEAQGRG
jgi:hypothetical protein